MSKFFKLIGLILLTVSFNSTSFSKENFFNEALELFKKEKYEELLIEPDNEEALLMLMKIALEKSNYEKVKDLSEKFVKVCKNLCDENKDIQESLKNIEPENNES